MKITMIGDRGCGKTTFMAGLYREMTDPEFFLNIVLSNPDQRARVDAIAQNLSRGYYPSATSFEQEYNFDFTIDGVKLLDFTWYDYRGGALMEGIESQESRQLFSDIVNSDGLLVFIDQTTLDNPKWDSKSRYWRTIKQAVVQHASCANENKPRSLGIIHTKMDEPPCTSPYPIGENVIELIQSLPNRENLCGMLAYSAITRDSSINTINIFLRIMTPFIIAALQEQAYKIKHTNEMNELLQNIDNNYNSAGMIDDFLSGLFGETSSREQVTACVNMLKQYPLFQSRERRFLISSFLNHWNNRSVFDDLGTAFFGGRSQSSIAAQEFSQIIDIWVKFANDINSLFGGSEFIMKYLEENNGFDKGGYLLF